MSDFTKYAAVHEPSKRNGPGDGRTTALEIINDNDLRSAWPDKVILVTGCSSGIGIPTVEALAATGAKIYAAARDLQKARLALSETLSNSSNKIELLEIDLGSLSSVRKAAATFLSKESKLNILVNNAGIMAVPNLELTKDGFESQLGTNHLGHFLLFQLLKPALLAASTPSFHSRVVNVSSIGHRFAEPNFDDLELKQPGAYDPWKAYGVSKTASIWTANEIERRFGSGSSAHMSSGSAIHGHSLHPGGIQSGLQVHAQHIWDVTYSDPEAAKRVKSPEQGAATSVWAAVDKVWEGKGGKWLEDCQVTGPIDPKSENFSGAPGHSPWAFNDNKGRKLWEVSCQLVGVDGDRRS